MMERRLRILVAAPEAEAGHVSGLLLPEHTVQSVVSEEHCRAELKRNPEIDLLLISSCLTEGNLAIFAELRSVTRAPIVVMIGSYTGADLILQASHSGVRGFVSTPVLRDNLQQVIGSVCGQRKAPEPAGEPGPFIEELGDGPFFLAASPAMLDIVRQVRMLSRADVPVLITGESGVGKEVVAMLLHKYSLRASRPILKVNCAALPADLLESELFGYEAGAFTGAMKAKPGKFELCDKGTMLLDEIGEMSPQLQAKLLHVLQDGCFSRLGARVNSKVDVRIIAATNVDIEQAILNKTFREDLYYRLNAFILHVPPLRERRQEIPYLLRELASSLAKAHNLEPAVLTPRLIAAAMQYHWPGNLRELGNFVKRYLIMRNETAALVEIESKLCLKTPERVLQAATPAARVAADPGLKSMVRSTRDQTESRVIQEALDDSKWNRRIAAERLQISYKSLLQKIRYYELGGSTQGFPTSQRRLLQDALPSLQPESAFSSPAPGGPVRW